MNAWRRLLAFLLIASASAGAWAHKPSDSYLRLHAGVEDGVVDVQWDIALRDLEIVLALDANRDGAISWGELRARQADVFAYALAHLALRAEGRTCVTTPGDLLVDDHSDGAYAVLRIAAHCGAELRSVDVTYSLLFDVDPSHRGLVSFTTQSGSHSAVMSPEQATQRFGIAGSSRWSTFVQFVADGMHHIWIGYDHMLFLISLLLPSVLVRRDGRWQPVGSLRSAVLGVLAVVSAFTVAHSVTLSLAAFDVIGLPSRFVESAIALSVVLAALNNVWPRVTRRAWMLAFAFGLVHGFGFASVLADLELPRDAFALALAGFNIGVEIGQLTVVMLVVPLIFVLRARRFYRPAVLVGGSCLIAAAAGVWFVGRAFDIGLG